MGTQNGWKLSLEQDVLILFWQVECRLVLKSMACGSGHVFDITFFHFQLLVRYFRFLPFTQQTIWFECPVSPCKWYSPQDCHSFVSRGMQLH